VFVGEGKVVVSDTMVVTLSSRFSVNYLGEFVCVSASKTIKNDIYKER